MPSSSNHRSSSTHTSRRAHTHRQVPTTRSSSAPQRRFIIILTNNPDLLRQTLVFQPQTEQQVQTTVSNPNGPIRRETANNNNNNNHTNNREQILSDLLRVELREVARDYLSRTRRSYPIHYVFNMSDIDSSEQSNQA